MTIPKYNEDAAKDDSFDRWYNIMNLGNWTPQRVRSNALVIDVSYPVNRGSARYFCVR
jgi:hypothetical protein